MIELKEYFGGQYDYFKEKLDPRFPKPLIPEMNISVFLDSDHSHDKKNWTINHWNIWTCWIYSHCVEIKETTNCTNLYIQGRIHGVEDGY